MSSVDRFRAAVQGSGDILISGEVQFWRMDPAHWRTALLAVKRLGIDHIATYLSWRRHEPSPGSFDLRGGHGDKLNVHAFLELCAELDLSVQLKPGPWICAEEPGGGLPDWLIADADLIARDWRGEPVSGYNPPFKHPMPSYASSRFRSHTADWITKVWNDLRPYLGESGPIVATQLDNEPSLGFQDSMYGFDYHPEAIDAFRRFALERHGSLDELAASWERPIATIDAIHPPMPRSPHDAPLQREDWISFQEHYIADYLGWLQSVNRAAGVDHLVDFVNLNTHPVRGMPQSGDMIARRLQQEDGIAVVGEDHYFEPPVDLADITGLALATAQGAATSTTLLWAPEMQSGIWRSPGEVVSYADPTIADLATWWGLSLMLGYRGFNLYMLVDRENWEFAPIAGDGEPRAVAAQLGRLMQVIASVSGLAQYRPIADIALDWNPEVRRRAYGVRGTQAAPLVEWDEPLERIGYDRLERAAAVAVASGLQFELRETSDSSRKELLLVRDDADLREQIDGGYLRPSVAADSDGVLVRLWCDPSQQEVLCVVPIDASIPGGPIAVSFRDRRTGWLRDSLSSHRYAIEQGAALIDEVELGLNLFVVET